MPLETLCRHTRYRADVPTRQCPTARRTRRKTLPMGIPSCVRPWAHHRRERCMTPSVCRSQSSREGTLQRGRG